MDVFGAASGDPQECDAMRVLLVDDDPGVVELTADYLEREDDRIETVTATSVADGLAEFTRADIDCIVSDYEMPERTGLGFLEAIRETDPNVPFILFTGKGSEEIAVEAIKRGVTDYLQKGTGTDQYTVLGNRVENAVAQHRAEERASQHARILSLTRRVNQALVRADSRWEIEAAVCEILTAEEGYDALWIGKYDADEDVVYPTDAANVRLVSTSVSIDRSSTGVGSVVGDAIRSGDIQVRTGDESVTLPSRDVSTRRSYSTVAVVPIGYREQICGVLGVYTADDNSFSEAELAMFDEIAGDLGHGIHAIELRDDLRRHQTAVTTVPEGVFVLDDEATIELVNESAATLGDRTPEDLEGEPFLTLVEEGIFDEEIVDWYVETVRELLSSESDTEDAHFMTELTPVDGERRLVEIHLTLRPFDTEFRGTVGIIRDVTERHETHQELEGKNERLDQFASVISHDLRNPITIATGNLKLYRSTGDDEQLERVEEALTRIEELTEDLTMLARDRETAIERESVSLPEVAADAWAMIDPRAATLSVEDCQVTGEASQLQGLLENLFRNAVGHGGADVTVNVGPLDGGFYVEDTGRGMSAAQREQIFDHGYSTGYGGQGVGLTIVQRIANAHEFDVTVTEGDAGGARFEFRR